MHSKKHKSQMSIIEFQKKYDTEDKCREELFKMRYPKGFKCSKCECTEYYYLKSRGKYQCKVSVKYPTPSKKQKAGLRSVRLKQKITKRNE